MARASSITVDIALNVKRMERGEVEAIPELWSAVYGEEIDPTFPVQDAVNILASALINIANGDPVEDPDDIEYADDDDGEPVVLTDDELEAVAELRHLRVERKDIEDREKVLRKEILQRLGRSTRALTADGRPAAILRKQVRTGVNRKKLEAEYPEVFDDVMTETEVTVLDLP